MFTCGFCGEFSSDTLGGMMGHINTCPVFLALGRLEQNEPIENWG